MSYSQIRYNHYKYRPIEVFSKSVIYMVVTLPNVCGEIGVNCGPGAVVGQPYRMECTNIPAVTNGLNVFLEGESNSIIQCFTTKVCAPRDSLLYSVQSPHNESLYFTILKVTSDDIGRKLYCVDDAFLSLPKPYCKIGIVKFYIWILCE
ncbi:hypothetical protein LOTGIDRAFT_239572 [Lottia gigantea]|uniref:Uncharacterized protein n=1 Tax=Lottia gigantea TaxID=225164 RepID=V4AH01_LOTGI|nr:hypothetical protein LOTGIDRAFT_239572 [Lottia gigantea]ESO92686.1 hypothetical protein LOTGIDRAFT_239572 [Lottia gigantea]